MTDRERRESLLDLLHDMERLQESTERKILRDNLLRNLQERGIGFFPELIPVQNRERVLQALPPLLLTLPVESLPPDQVMRMIQLLLLTVLCIARLGVHPEDRPEPGYDS